jgi:hypothetical protein
VDLAPIPVPPALKIPGLPRVVFAHFRHARHRIVLDVPARTMSVKSDITFDLPQYGRPVIDLTPTAARNAGYFIDGKRTPTIEIIAPLVRKSPLIRDAAHFLALDDPFEPGTHHAHVTYDLKDGEAVGVEWEKDRVRLFFKMSDYFPKEERHFLERYLPANLEFDQHPVQIEVEILGAKVPHVAIANGGVAGDLHGSFQISYPAWYSSSCPFLFIGARGDTPMHRFTAPRDGAEHLPVTVFADRESLSPAFWQPRIENALAAVQPHFGPFPHEQLIVKIGEEGMEYAGAVSTGRESLLHEIVHCYFARSVLPSNGDSGWIDEGVAHWYAERATNQSPAVPWPGPLNIGSVSPHRRDTIPDHRFQARDIFFYLDGEYPGKLLPFLKKLHQEHQRRQMDSRRLQLELERHLGADLGPLFDRCVYDVK